jgi:ABC-type uncharacterized transport system fused permease/ATPase subunit
VQCNAGVGGVGLIRLLAPDFRRFTAAAERLQAELRTAHERVESNAESIAFQVSVHHTMVGKCTPHYGR